MQECLTGLNFTEEEKDGVFRIVAAVMFLSALKFKEGPSADSSQIVPNNIAWERSS